MTSHSIVIATPHGRHDMLETRVRQRLAGYSVVRLRAPDELSLDTLQVIDPKFVFFPHWSWLIPEAIHTRFECVIFHMTDVPYGRGGSPLQNLIIRGHEETILSAIKCVNDVDAGPAYGKRPLSLAGTAEEILRRAAESIEGMIVDIVEQHPTPVPQQGSIVEFKRRQPTDGDLSPLGELRQVNDFIRMLDADGYPPAFVDTEHLRLEFSDARLDDSFIEARVRIRKKAK